MASQPIRIEKVLIQSFRGFAEETTLPLKGKSLMLYGENGSGKSSFIDALEKVLTGRVSSLDGRAQGLSSETQGRHISATGPMRVELTLTGGVPITLEKKPSNAEARVADYLQTAREPFYILRRQQLIAFVDSKPKDRYDQLKPFLPLDQHETRETAVKRQSRVRDRSVSRA